MPPSPTVLITGTSSGIGLAAALEMKQRGWTVFAAARKTEDLENLKSRGLKPVHLDVADSHSIDRAMADVLDQCGGSLTGLVNNAGFGQPGALEDLSREAMLTQFEVNVFGLQELTNRFLPGMIKQGHGRIVQISSVVGRVSLPFMGIYSASKFAVEAMADAQRVELFGTGVRLSLVEPGPITTLFSKNAITSTHSGLTADTSRFADLYQKELSDRARERDPRPFSLPPEAVARKIAHALTSSHPRRRYKVTFPAYLGAFMSRAAPDTLIDWILSSKLRKRS
jgi:short-subunit dehydrogenase